MKCRTHSVHSLQKQQIRRFAGRESRREWQHRQNLYKNRSVRALENSLAEKRTWQMQTELGIPAPRKSLLKSYQFKEKPHARQKGDLKPELWKYSHSKVGIHYSYPRTMSEAQYFVHRLITSEHRDSHSDDGSSIWPVKCTVFGESDCPFSQNSLRFLDSVGIRYIYCELDRFAYRQLIQNELRRVCDNDHRAKGPPVIFFHRCSDGDTLCMSSAQCLGESWVNGSMHRFYPNALSPDKDDPCYDAEYSIDDWNQATQMLGLLRESYGYERSTPPTFTEPVPTVIHEWSRLTRMPVFTKDIGNPLRPQLVPQVCFEQSRIKPS